MPTEDNLSLLNAIFDDDRTMAQLWSNPHELAPVVKRAPHVRTVSEDQLNELISLNDRISGAVDPRNPENPAVLFSRIDNFTDRIATILSYISRQGLTVKTEGYAVHEEDTARADRFGILLNR